MDQIKLLMKKKVGIWHILFQVCDVHKEHLGHSKCHWEVVVACGGLNTLGAKCFSSDIIEFNVIVSLSGQDSDENCTVASEDFKTCCGITWNDFVCDTLGFSLGCCLSFVRDHFPASPHTPPFSSCCFLLSP